LNWFEAAPPAAADKGFARFRCLFQLNGGRALRGTLVAVVRSTLIELNSGRSEEDKVEVQDREVGIPSFEASRCLLLWVLPTAGLS